MGCAKENVEIGALGLGKRFVGPGVSRAAAVKIDMRRDDRLGGRAALLHRRQSRSPLRGEIAVELANQLSGIGLIHAAHVGGDARRRAAKFAYDAGAVVTE